MILAKSEKSGVSLLEHTRAVVESAEAMFGTTQRPTRLFKSWQRFFKLKDVSRFHPTLFAAAAFHDLGKANDGFDAAVRRTGHQIIRHEHLSGLILCLPNVRRAIQTNESIDFSALLSAVISHHLKVTERSFAKILHERSSLKLLVDDPDFPPLLEYVREICGLTCLPAIPKWWDVAGNSPSSIRSLRKEVIDNALLDISDWVADENMSDRHRLLQMVRTALIVADAVGSAQPRHGMSIDRFIAKCFTDLRLRDRDSIYKDVIQPRVASIESIHGKKFHWNQFQTDCDALPERSLLLAPCGSGKTLAAWRWIAERCRRPVSHVIFLYPTRATATEGFRDYVSWAPEAEAALMHGTAEYDLDGMFENPEELNDRGSKDYRVDAKLFALGFWSKQIFSATVDQFLAFMQHNYGSTCVLPLLADAVVVFDEVHSFDQRMFSALRNFLQNFDVPALCMTATLPESRVRALRHSGLIVNGPHPADLQEIAHAPRYSIRRGTSQDDVKHQVERFLAMGKRVLWVVNQVRRAQEIIASFSDPHCDTKLRVNDTTDLYCYHSRYRLIDRRERHREVVDAIHPDRPPALAVTTQVCEMSLDLDADVLVTEFAPATSLIQRMGRCNRAQKPRAGAGICLIYRPDNHLPYDEQTMVQAEHFLKKIEGDSRSQTDLEQALQQIDIPPDLPRESGFLTSAPYASADELSFRDLDGFTVPALLDCDLAEFLGDTKSRQGLLVPAPQRLARRSGIRMEKPPRELPKFITILPSEFYEQTIGLHE